MLRTEIKPAKYFLISGGILFLATLTVVALVAFDQSRSKSSDRLGLPGGSEGVKGDAQRGTPESPTLSSQPSSPADEIEDEMANLKRQQLELSRKFKEIESTLKQDPSASASKESAQEPEIALDPETMRANQEAEEELINAQMEAQVELLNSTIDKQAPDLQWAAEAKYIVEDIIAQKQGFKVDLRSVQCGSTLCRLELILPRDQPMEQSHYHLMDLIPWAGESFFAIDPSGAVTVYVARENQFLPKISN